MLYSKSNLKINRQTVIYCHINCLTPAASLPTYRIFIPSDMQRETTHVILFYSKLFLCSLQQKQVAFFAAFSLFFPIYSHFSALSSIHSIFLFFSTRIIRREIASIRIQRIIPKIPDTIVGTDITIVIPARYFITLFKRLSIIEESSSLLLSDS